MSLSWTQLCHGELELLPACTGAVGERQKTHSNKVCVTLNLKCFEDKPTWKSFLSLLDLHHVTWSCCWPEHNAVLLHTEPTASVYCYWVCVWFWFWWTLSVSQMNMQSVSVLVVIKYFNCLLFDRLKADLSEYSTVSTLIVLSVTPAVFVSAAVEPDGNTPELQTLVSTMSEM